MSVLYKCNTASRHFPREGGPYSAKNVSLVAEPRLDERERASSKSKGSFTSGILTARRAKMEKSSLEDKTGAAN